MKENGQTAQLLQSFYQVGSVNDWNPRQKLRFPMSWRTRKPGKDTCGN
ncbi:hypothetical protein L798_08523 [Zootermopsis nevadensis]|uniref:Uncharacterized protein n=1 Tax=Zootermopsis nevadensis TaxID=136037 RepID=A0A067R398_ZOONE|nr:hypothetical protein L798_08523 [Zootermopsis nevadensis]